MISNAIDRPNRKTAAAATGEQNGRGVDHGARLYGQIRFPSRFGGQITRQIHSMILPSTSPNSSSTADQIRAETKFAAWKVQ